MAKFKAGDTAYIIESNMTVRKVTKRRRLLQCPENKENYHGATKTRLYVREKAGGRVSVLYVSLTDFIPLIKNITYGKWYPEKQSGDGSAEHPFQMPFVSYDNVVEALIREVYAFVDAHPEYELRHYNQILENNHIKWENDSMMAADVSQLDGQCVMALLLGAIRAERFCDGALLGFFEKGCVGRWLDRLKEIDESGVKGVYEDP